MGALCAVEWVLFRRSPPCQHVGALMTPPRRKCPCLGMVGGAEVNAPRPVRREVEGGNLQEHSAPGACACACGCVTGCVLRVHSNM